MRLVINLSLDSSALQGEEDTFNTAEISRLLWKAGKCIEQGKRHFKLMDSNGNSVGTVDYPVAD